MHCYVIQQFSYFAFPVPGILELGVWLSINHNLVCYQFRTGCQTLGMSGMAGNLEFLLLYTQVIHLALDKKDKKRVLKYTFFYFIFSIKQKKRFKSVFYRHECFISKKIPTLHFETISGLTWQQKEYHACIWTSNGVALTLLMVPHYWLIENQSRFTNESRNAIVLKYDFLIYSEVIRGIMHPFFPT